MQAKKCLTFANTALEIQVGRFWCVLNVYQDEVLNIVEVHALDEGGNITGQVLPREVTLQQCQNAYDQWAHEQQNEPTDDYDTISHALKHR